MSPKFTLLWRRVWMTGVSGVMASIIPGALVGVVAMLMSGDPEAGMGSAIVVSAIVATHVFLLGVPALSVGRALGWQGIFFGTAIGAGLGALTPSVYILVLNILSGEWMTPANEWRAVAVVSGITAPLGAMAAMIFEMVYRGLQSVQGRWTRAPRSARPIDPQSR